VEAVFVALADNLVTSLLVAVLTALLTVSLALRRFRAERWWERKANAYSSILNALHVIKRAIEDDLRYFENPNRRPDEDRERRLADQYRAALDEIYRAVDTSSFLLAPKAADALNELTLAFEKPENQAHREGRPPLPDDFSAQINAIDECLKELPGIAKQDLSIAATPWLGRFTAPIRRLWGS
jgi:hypothetical protein